MKGNLEEKIPGYAKTLYRKIQRSLLAAADFWREKNTGHRLKQLLRNFDPRDLERELGSHHKNFAYLLEPTARFLLGRPTPYFSAFESLDSAWKYCLDDETTPCLQRLYLIIRTAAGEEALRLWMAYLRQQGFCRIQEQLDTVILSPAVRTCYDNTLNLADGTPLPIESHPWAYKEDLIFGGMLKR